MCGIAGIIGPPMARTGPEMRELIGRMCQVIRHRGPDDEGHWIDAEGDGVALGMRRLAIIDLKSGRQPIANEDQTVWIVFNGEIYNYRELRPDLISRGHRFRTQSDTEVIVHLYEEMGERCVERLRGMFAFAIWDRRKRRLLLARDRAGKKPLHFALLSDGLVFGSEIKSILQDERIRREADPEALSDYLAFGYVPDPATAFKGIRKLPPGETLIYEQGAIHTRRYWDFSYCGRQEEETEGSTQARISRLRELLAEAVRLRLLSEVPLGAFLSGGVDSSVVVALMAREMKEPVKTFSIGFAEAGYNELEYARLTARRFQTDHHELVVTPDVCRLLEETVWHHDEPFGDVSSVPTYLVSKLAREHVTVILSGDGGDELFAGYDRYAIERNRAGFERIPRFLRRGLLLPLSAALPNSAYGKNFLRNIALDAPARYIDALTYLGPSQQRHLLAPELRRRLSAYDAGAAFRALYSAPRDADPLERLLYLDSRTYLPGDILTKVDRMSMANSIETRAPLLDQELIEFVGTIPANLKLHHGAGKYIFKRAVEDLIPPEIINRPKHGFDVPINKWFNGPLREMLIDTLRSRRSIERGLLNPRAVGALISEHERGRRDHARHLWGLLSLELWHRMFIDRRPEAGCAVSAIKFECLRVGAERRPAHGGA